MDLIYMDDKKRDIGVMKNFTLDLAFGEDENNFELSTVMENNVCESGMVFLEVKSFNLMMGKTT